MLRSSRDRQERSSNGMDRKQLHPSARAQLSSAANCARGKHHLTPREANGRANLRRVSDELKRATVQETEQPAVSVAEVCRRHGGAASMVFRLRADFGLATRKAQRLVNMALVYGAASELPAFAALRELPPPPGGMMAIELEDGQLIVTPSAAIRLR